MLPSQSTLAKDPSLLPLCGVGAAAPSGLPVSPAGDDVCGAADFGALIADLEPTETTAEPTAPDLGVCCLPVLGLAFAPPPAPLAAEPTLMAGANGTVDDANETIVATADGIAPWAGQTHGRAEWKARGGSAAFATGADGAGRAFGRAGETGTQPGPLSAPTTAPVAGPAAETPRYAGLPAAALEHRQAATLPPGLARLQALHAGATAPEHPDEFAAAAGVNAGRSDAAEFGGAGRGPRVALPGVLPIEGELPADTARAALERNGVAAEAAGQPLTALTLAMEEKIAARRDRFVAAELEPVGRGKKSFLGSEEEAVAQQGRSLGTDGAKATHAMPATFLPAPPTHPNSPYATPSIAPAGPAVSEAAALAELPDTLRTAHEAVEVVLHAVEHVAAREQTSVQLRFAVAGEELAVRVELHADEVRTTFRTDSAELRAALEHEWQQLAGTAASPDRSVRIPPAVFAAAGQSALNAFAGDTSSRDRRAGTPRDEFELPVAGVRGRSVAAVAPAVALPVAAAPARSGGTHRLHTLA
jgi:hypothetical protein